MVAIWGLPMVKIWEFLPSNVKQLINLIFIIYLELMEDLHLGFVMVNIVIYVVVLWVFWKWYVYIVEEIHKVLGYLMVKEKALNDMNINWSLYLVY